MKINDIPFRLLGVIFSIFCAISCLAADPTATKDNYNVTMNDGTVLVGTIQIKKVAFNASYGATDVSLGDVVSFSGGFLILNDGSKLKGSFSTGNFTLETARGEMNLPFASITSIAKESAVAAAVLATPAPVSPAISSSSNGANLTGQVFDCFGKPLAGVSVAVQNTRFATTTDAQGNYSLGYVLGKIQVSFSKAGYYTGGLTFEIATPSTYPVQNVTLMKEPPFDNGMFFIGDNGYVTNNGFLQQRDINPASYNQSVTRGFPIGIFVSGQPVYVGVANKDFAILIKAPLTFGHFDTPLIPALCRVQQGGLFMTKAKNGFDMVSYIPQLNIGEAKSYEDGYTIWIGRLDAGRYILITETHDFNGDNMHEPFFYFRVGDEANVTSDSAIANPSRNLPTQEATSTSKPTEDSDDFVIAKGSGFEIKRSQLDQVMVGI
jgi:Carboxypeptidase regulatory-like domain